MTYQNGQISKMTTKDSKLVRCYGVSKTSVSFRYQLKLLCDVLSWSVSLKYQLIRRYDVPKLSVLFTHQWDITKMSQKGPTNWHTNFDVIMMFQHGSGRSNKLLKWTNLFCVLCSKLLRCLRWFSLFKVPTITLLQRLKDVGLI